MNELREYTDLLCVVAISRRTQGLAWNDAAKGV